jgi:CubicO group peptidase (beta-lactamase class C family)
VANGIQRLILSLAILGIASCGGGGDGDGEAPNPFAAVDAAARTAFQAQSIDGMGLAIYTGDGVKVFEKMYGAFSPDQRVSIASASKLVSGVTIFRLIDQGFLSLDSTTGDVLGWTGPNAAITLRHLLSFTSGLPPENLCTYQPEVTLADCVELISESTLDADPGTRFDYGSTHLAVAGRMAEVVTGRAWNDLFGDLIRDTIGMPSDIVYYTNGLRAVGTINPLLAGGLRVSMNEYERLLHFVYDKGVWQGRAVLAPGIFDTQAIAPYPDAEVGQSPTDNTSGVRYGLTAWLECATPATGCTTLSSPGVFGFTPWWDRSAGYYAILGLENIRNPSTTDNFAVILEQQLKPLIVEALACKSAAEGGPPHAGC